MGFLILDDDSSVRGSTSSRVGANITSGETAPTSFTVNCALWYDTKENYIKFTEDSGVTWSHASFPLFDGRPVTSKGWTGGFEHIFNGFGYIGSTIFVLPGVKGLIPNGRNDDGSLNNIEFDTSGVLTDTETYYRPFRMQFYIRQNVLGNTTSYSYNAADNYNKSSVDNAIGYACIVGSFRRGTNGVITDFTIPYVFQQTDRTDGTFLSAQSMPSSNYIDLTLGASGSTYTAPANGWVFVQTKATAVGQFLIVNSANGQASTYAATSSQSTGCIYPAKKGMAFIVHYSTAGATEFFRFLYAEGEV